MLLAIRHFITAHSVVGNLSYSSCSNIGEWIYERDHPLFPQEYREYARGQGVKFTCTLFKNVDLSSSTTERNNTI